jgi:ribosome biogenesis GTPase A
VSFTKQVQEVIRLSDIILLVVDARMIGETRNPELEAMVKAEGKYLVHVVNKADLIDVKGFDRTQLEGLSYPVLVSYKSGIGLGKLRTRIRILAKQSRKERGYERVQVGIVGYPNVGKSSVVNFLTHRKLASTAQQTGLTRGIQYARLGKDLLLLDSPGVLGTSEVSPYTKSSTSKLAITAAASVDKIKDPTLVVHELLQEHQVLFDRYYAVSTGGDSEVLLEAVGTRWKFMKKGGVVDSDKVARKIIREWQAGKITG